MFCDFRKKIKKKAKNKNAEILPAVELIAGAEEESSEKMAQEVNKLVEVVED